MASTKPKGKAHTGNGNSEKFRNSVKARPPSDTQGGSPPQVSKAAASTDKKPSQPKKKTTAKKSIVGREEPERGKKSAIKGRQTPTGQRRKAAGKTKQVPSKKEAKKRRKEESARRLELEKQLAAEDSQAYENLLRRRNAWKKKRRKRAYILLLTILSTAGIYLCCRMFLTISVIEVSGQSRYTDEELILSSGLKIGDNLFDFDTETVEKTILDGHVYLESVTVRRSLPTTVEIYVTPVLETGVVKGEMGFSIISTGGKVLETGILYPPSELPIINGLQLNVSRADNESLANVMDKRLETLSEINRALTENKITGITMIDLSDPMNLTITYQGRVKINLGNKEKINDKIRMSVDILEQVDPSQEGNLNLSIDKKGFFRAENIYGTFAPASTASSPLLDSEGPEDSSESSNSSSAVSSSEEG